MQKISYIFPIYNESGNIDLLYKTISQLQSKHGGFLYENIFINDGSKDDSLERLLRIQRKNKNVIVIDFSRNFGHQLAVTAGLDEAKGDAVIIMDSDMQDPPSVSFELIKKWQEGYDVVYAQRRSRKDTPFKKITASLFYKILRKVAEIDIPKDTGDFRLVDRKVVEAVKKFREQNRFLRGIISSVGFKQTAVLFDRDKRHTGQTNYSFKKMLKLAADGILGFSTYPLKLIRNVGLFIATLAFAGVIYALIIKLISPATVVPGWTFIVMSVLFVGGIQLIMLGVLGSYIGRIYHESQQRPLYIIRSVYGQD